MEAQVDLIRSRSDGVGFIVAISTESVTSPIGTQHRSLALAPSSRSVPGSMDVFYLVYREGFSSVFHAQVLVPLAQQSSDVNMHLGVFVPLGHLVRPHWRNKLAQLRRTATETYGLRLSTLCTSPSRWRWLRNDVALLRRWLRMHRTGNRPYIVQCRNAVMTSIALQACADDKHARVIFDCRGEEVAEQIQRLGLENSPPETWSATDRQSVDSLRGKLARSIRDSAQVNCVSEAMRDYFAEEYELNPARSLVIPCCPDVEKFTVTSGQRAATRDEFGLNDKFVVSYCGSMALYQLPQQSLRVFKLIANFMPNAHFLAITTQPDLMRGEIQSAGIDASKVTLVSVPPQDVPRCLAAADVGLLLRDESLINQVASPVKFGEYMAAGLPVIISEGVGDFSQAAADHRLGCVVRLSDSDANLTTRLLEFAETDLKEDRELRERCHRYAFERLSWWTHLPRMEASYRELLESTT